MKIASFADKEGSAIDRLCRMNLSRLKHYDMTHMCVHPKRPEPRDVDVALQLILAADIVDCQYWKTGVLLRQVIEGTHPTFKVNITAEDRKILEKKKWILTHHNEHNIEGDWEWKKFKWDAHVVKNGWQKAKLEAQGYAVQLIKHAIEFKNFSFADQLTDEKTVIYVGQIKKVKGVREIKQACDELGYRLMIVGKPSEAEYWEKLSKSNLLWLHDVPDQETSEFERLTISKAYQRARVFVCNSDDGTESGTMPILEAMASGIPVVTRKIGLVRDCGEHQKNMFIRSGRYDDVEDLKAALKMVMENDDVADQLRENAWRTVRQYHPDIQAREYDKLFHKVMYPDQVPVSVIIPTCNRADVLLKNLSNLENQSHKNFEAVVIDDGFGSEKIPPEAFPHFDFPVRWLSTDKKDPAEYGLAKARNIGAIEAIGEVLVFCDDRLAMHEGAIANFVKDLNNAAGGTKNWLWGSKGVFKSFVENFSAVWRRAFIDAGMFNERIDRYGGMGQEVSGRFAAQGFRFSFCPGAIAEPIMTTHSKSKHREDIIASKIKLYKMGFQ